MQKSNKQKKKKVFNFSNDTHDEKFDTDRWLNKLNSETLKVLPPGPGFFLQRPCRWQHCFPSIRANPNNRRHCLFASVLCVKNANGN